MMLLLQSDRNCSSRNYFLGIRTVSDSCKDVARDDVTDESQKDFFFVFETDELVCLVTGVLILVHTVHAKSLVDGEISDQAISIGQPELSSNYTLEAVTALLFSSSLIPHNKNRAHYVVIIQIQEKCFAVAPVQKNKNPTSVFHSAADATPQPQRPSPCFPFTPNVLLLCTGS